jgi:hypothetical protein
MSRERNPTAFGLTQSERRVMVNRPGFAGGSNS